MNIKNKPPGTPEPVAIPDENDLEWTIEEEGAFLKILEDADVSFDLSE